MRRQCFGGAMRLRVAFIPFSTAPEWPRSYRAEISCLLERLSRAHRVASHDRVQRNSKDKDGRDLSLSRVRQNPAPNNGAQTASLCESAAELLATIRTLRVRVRFSCAIQRGPDRSRALCRGCPSRAAKIRSLSTEGRDLSG